MTAPLRLLPLGDAAWTLEFGRHLDPALAERVARLASGFVYCVSLAGVTGARTELPAGLVDRVAWLRSKASVPVLVGFGVSGPEQVAALSKVADGAIVGSALLLYSTGAWPTGP